MYVFALIYVNRKDRQKKEGDLVIEKGVNANGIAMDEKDRELKEIKNGQARSEEASMEIMDESEAEKERLLAGNDGGNPGVSTSHSAGSEQGQKQDGQSKPGSL